MLTILSEQLEDYDFDFEDDVYFASMDKLIKEIINSFRLHGKFSYLFSVAMELKLDLTECVNIAWNQIKDRKGKTVNGTFIKD